LKGKAALVLPINRGRPDTASISRGHFAMTKFVSLLQDESGASAAEYALILAIVGAGIAGAAVILGQSISSAIGAAATTIDGTY